MVDVDELWEREWERWKAETEKHRLRYRQLAADPAWRERKRAYNQAYRERHRERIRTSNREYMRRWRADRRAELARLAALPVTASLHEIRCPYPDERCSCRPILIVREEGTP